MQESFAAKKKQEVRGFPTQACEAKPNLATARRFQLLMFHI